MTNIGNEKSPNRVHRNIVPIVPVPPMKSTQTIEHQSLRVRNNKNFNIPETETRRLAFLAASVFSDTSR